MTEQTAAQQIEEYKRVVNDVCLEMQKLIVARQLSDTAIISVAYMFLERAMIYLDKPLEIKYKSIEQYVEALKEVLKNHKEKEEKKDD